MPSGSEIVVADHLRVGLTDGIVDGRPVVVRGKDVKVSFRTTQERYPTFRSSVRTMLERGRSNRTVDALKGVTFSVPQGRIYGVIGRNGAGKSTLFRAVAGILAPTAGKITVAGRVTPLLSLGVGFNRELTGRENVLLGGLAAGLNTEEIAEQYQNILRFAELGAAIDSPMRTYSSGMFGRLGFAIAVHLKPDILLIDEALSAGDAAFKEKCSQKIDELSEGECTFMLVTHGLGMVRQKADYALWIDQGMKIAEGPAAEIVDAYLENEGVSSQAPAAMQDV